MDEYDEDLSENPWYLALVHNNNKLFLQATSERWIICIPRSGSWKGDADTPKTFTSSYFKSHCIKFESEEVPKKDDGSTSPAKHINKYVTFNGKTILIEGSRMTCGSGFEEAATSFDSRSGHLDLPSSGLNHTARILFEETYFNANDQSYKMLCISRPIELHLIAGQEPGESNTEEYLLSPTSGDFKFTSEKLLGQQLWGRASNGTKLKNNVDAKIGLYIKSHGTGKTVNEPVYLSQGMNESIEMDERAGIKTCLTSVQNLFNTCLQIVMKDAKIKREMETNIADNTKSAVEKYLLQEIYRSLFRQISSVVATQEAAFNKMMCNLSDIQPTDLEIDKKYWLSLPRAKRHLSRINKCCTPHDKLSCIQRTVFCITAKQENAALGSDDLLPMLIYLIIKSNIPNWISNLIYLLNFQLVPILNEQYSFYLTTLEAAVEHLKHGEMKVTTILSPRSEDIELSAVQLYFQNVQNGNVLAVKELLCKSADERKLREQKRCHPLCACEKCTEIKRRSASKAGSMITVHVRNDKGQTALHIAASYGHHELVDLLVGKGAELNATDYHGSTPLHCAALAGSQSAVFLLLHHGGNPNATDNNANTPLHLCSQRGHETCAKAFLYFDPAARNASVDMMNDDGDTPLHIASRWGFSGIVAALLECGADPRATNRRRESAFDVSLNSKVSSTIKSAADQVIKIVRTLRHLQPTKGKDENVDRKQIEKRPRQRTNTPKELQNTIDNVYVSKQVEKLFRAVSDNDINMVKFLCGWQTNDEDKTDGEENKDTQCDPLCQCTKCNPLSHEHVLHANSCNQEKYTGLMLAAKNGFLEMARLFLEQGATVNAKTKKHEYSPLHFASENGKAEVAELILSQQGAKPDIRDISGSTALYMCAIYNYPSCALVLLKHKASVNIRNRNGDTPLHAAVKWNNIDIVKILLEHEAKVYYKNNDGLTPVDFAKEDELKSLLLSAPTSEESFSPVSSFIGISPHTVATSMKETFLQLDDEASVLKKHDLQLDSQSKQDEAIADSLYDQFKDPAPPTPPPHKAEEVSFPDDEIHLNIEEKLFQDDESQNEKNVHNVETSSPRKVSTGVSVTSDIFQDLLQDKPDICEEVFEDTSIAGESESLINLDKNEATVATILGGVVVESVKTEVLEPDCVKTELLKASDESVHDESENVFQKAGADSYFEIG